MATCNVNRLTAQWTSCCKTAKVTEPPASVIVDMAVGNVNEFCLSDGSVQPDALFDNFFLYHEEWSLPDDRLRLRFLDDRSCRQPPVR